MNDKIINRLMIVANTALAVAGIIFLCLSIFTETKHNTYLCFALGSILLSNLFHVIRYLKRKNH